MNGPDQTQFTINPKERKSLFGEIFNTVKDMYEKKFFSSKEMVEIFDKKYAHDGKIQLWDEKGKPIEGKNRDRIGPIEFEKIERPDKEAHIRGLLYSFTLNPVDFVRKLSEETALLELAEGKGSNLKKLVEDEMKNNPNK